MDDWWLPVLSSLAKPPGGPCWDLALQQQAWPSRKRAAGTEPSPRDTQKQHPVLFFPRTIPREVGRGLFVQLTEVKCNTSALHAKTVHYLKITLAGGKKKTTQKTPSSLSTRNVIFLILFLVCILTTTCTLNCLENMGEWNINLGGNIQIHRRSWTIKPSDLCSIKYGVQLIKNYGHINIFCYRIKDISYTA